MKKITIPNPVTKPVIIRKQIHSSLSSCSSNDEWLTIETTKDKLDFPLKSNSKIVSKSFPALNGEKINELSENLYIIRIYVKSDETFYRAGEAPTDSMKNLVRLYTIMGWTTKESSYSKQVRNIEQKLRIEARRMDGFVIPQWNDKLKPIDYQGGLSDVLFFHPYIQKYLVYGCHGYIGHSSRTFTIDREFEKVCLELGHSNDEIAVFMCSTRGRHYADQLDQVKDVKEYLAPKYGYWPSTENWFKTEVQEAAKYGFAPSFVKA